MSIFGMILMLGFQKCVIKGVLLPRFFVEVNNMKIGMNFP